jgi:hypothetical protein
VIKTDESKCKFRHGKFRHGPKIFFLPPNF